jgi:Flp pilus assembly protein TadB
MVTRSFARLRAQAEKLKEQQPMLWSTAVILALVWALGLLAAHTLGGYIHVLIATAVILVLVRTFQRRHHLEGWKRQSR